MARQEEIFLQTIAAMKRATARRNDASESDDSINQRTNRGNKLKRKAKFVEAGRLDTTDGPRTFKKGILFNGYSRSIVSQNPPRVDPDGDVIEYADDDSDADLTPAEDDPFAEIQLHNLLMPLTAAGDLKQHPSLSVPYTSKAIEEMIHNAREMLQREQEGLWRLKQLTNEFRGDQNWVPCGAFQTDNDGSLLAQFHFGASRPASSQADADAAPLSSEANWDTMANVRLLVDLEEASMDGGATIAHHDAYEGLESSGGNEPIRGYSNEADSGQEHASALVGQEQSQEDPPKPDPGATPSNGLNSYSKPIAEANEPSEGQKAVNGNMPEPVSATATATAPDAVAAAQQPKEPTHDHTNATVPPLPRPAASDSNPDTKMLDAADHDPDPDNDVDAAHPPHHMTTRTRARAEAIPSTPTSLRSSPVSSTITTPIHPFFLAPPAVLPSSDFGLPREQADETRRLLYAYVQRQEEVCRGVEALYMGLLRAKRMRDEVFEWCATESHVGQMSDGEDWVDVERWGLEEGELKKGEEVADEDDEVVRAKKTRNRRTAGA